MGREGATLRQSGRGPHQGAVVSSVLPWLAAALRSWVLAGWGTGRAQAPGSAVPVSAGWTRAICLVFPPPCFFAPHRAPVAGTWAAGPWPGRCDGALLQVDPPMCGGLGTSHFGLLPQHDLLCLLGLGPLPLANALASVAGSTSSLWGGRRAEGFCTCAEQRGPLLVPV